MGFTIVLCRLGVISTLIMSESSFAQDIEKTTSAQAACYSITGQEARIKRGHDAPDSNRSSGGTSSDVDRILSKDRDQVMAKCEPVDQRLEFLILLLQIMRGAK